MSFIEGPDRAQINLPPSSIEDYIAPEALVRVVDAFEAFAFDEGDTRYSLGLEDTNRTT